MGINLIIWWYVVIGYNGLLGIWSKGIWSNCFLNWIVFVYLKVIRSLWVVKVILLWVRWCWGLNCLSDGGMMLVRWVIRKNVNKKVYNRVVECGLLFNKRKEESWCKREGEIGGVW